MIVARQFIAWTCFHPVPPGRKHASPSASHVSDPICVNLCSSAVGLCFVRRLPDRAGSFAKVDSSVLPFAPLRLCVRFCLSVSHLLWVVASLTGLIFVPRATADSTFPAAKVASVLEGGRFKNLSTVKDVPTDVLKLCFPNHLPADPGKPWNQTDAVQDATLPFSRVQWLATDGTDWIFSWEHGGIAYTTGFMMIAKIGSTSSVVVWDAGPAKKQLETFHEFQEYVRSKGLFSGPSSFRP
jgi:hypothetical protein